MTGSTRSRLALTGAGRGVATIARAPAHESRPCAAHVAAIAPPSVARTAHEEQTAAGIYDAGNQTNDDHGRPVDAKWTPALDRETYERVGARRGPTEGLEFVLQAFPVWTVRFSRLRHRRQFPDGLRLGNARFQVLGDTACSHLRRNGSAIQRQGREKRNRSMCVTSKPPPPGSATRSKPPSNVRNQRASPMPALR